MTVVNYYERIYIYIWLYNERVVSVESWRYRSDSWQQACPTIP